jgi:ribosome-binding factor A
MTLHPRRREQLRALCAELRDDDGVDPRHFFKPSRRRNKEHRKARQLCCQVRKTLDLVLSSETEDELLVSLRVVAVTQGADASRLIVTVAADVPPDQFDPGGIATRLAAIQGRLRCEIAAAITRRKTPVLTFQVVPPAETFPERRDGDQP